jgi:hypothetical protein
VPPPAPVRLTFATVDCPAVTETEIGFGAAVSTTPDTKRLTLIVVPVQTLP